ncbi:MAG: 30S ribosomal protein S17 [Vampirovibrionales bacterium]
MATRQLQGIVVSNKSDKTIVVRVERLQPHPKYGKVTAVSKKFHAHDEHNQCNIGDEVLITESRPLSRLKRWALASVVRQADIV